LAVNWAGLYIAKYRALHYSMRERESFE
jgi:hypothetical protein